MPDKRTIEVPKLIKAGDLSLGLGESMTPPQVDCRVVAENYYQEMLGMLKEVKNYEKQYIWLLGIPLFKGKLSERIQEFIDAHELEDK